MKKILEDVRRDIRRNGYKTATRIKIELGKVTDTDTINKVLSNLECSDIKKIAYTNTYVADHIIKDMYYYNPVKSKPMKRSYNKTRRVKKIKST